MRTKKQKGWSSLIGLPTLVACIDETKVPYFLVISQQA